MQATRTAPRLSAALLAPMLLLGAGCELLDQFEDGGGLVNFYSSHHGTSVDGEMPSKVNDHIEFETDTGWHVILAEAYVTTTGVSLERCDGDAMAADLYWGALCENLVDPDDSPYGIGAIEAPAGNYCGATVTYGPESGGANAEAHTASNAAGSTIYLRGLATKDGQEVPFEISSTDTVSVDLDLRSIQDGGPLILDHDQYLARELTLTKTYDQFFQGIEFDSMDQIDLSGILIDTLVLESGVRSGT